MGMRSSWVAWRHLPVPDVLEALGLVAGDTVELMEPGLHTFPRGDHQLLVGNGFDFVGQITEVLARDLSHDAPVLFWTANDTSMDGRMSAWHHGEQQWAVVYPGGTLDPVLEGEVPELYATLLAEQRALQDAETDNVDHIYDVLHRLGATLVGFRHDEFEPPDGCAPYVELSWSDAELALSHLNEDDHIELTATGDWDAFDIQLTARKAGTYTVRRFDLDDDGSVVNLVEHGTVTLAAGESWSTSDASSHAIGIQVAYGDGEQLLLRVDR